MNENKQNTALLTVIAVATLLVAVVGATFAYFTASNSNNSTSKITATSGKMIIAFADKTADLNTLTETDFQPGDKVLIDKTFTLSGTNTAKASGTVTDDTTGLDMPYTVYLTYTNEFTSDAPEAEKSEGGLYYHLNGSIAGSATVDYADGTVTNMMSGYHSAIIPTTRTAQVKGENGHYPASERSIKLASGVFRPHATNESGAVITFTLKITFPDNGKAQDSNKGQTFTGKIEVNKVESEVTTYANR